jgi:hypothetical protein
LSGSAVKEWDVNLDFVVLVGTMMFWALLHLFSPDGRQWRHDIAATPDESEVPTALDAEASPTPAPAPAPRVRR